MVFFDGARALPGLRGALFGARGESQQPADLLSAPLSELGTHAWQVLGHTQPCFLCVSDAAKRARGKLDGGVLSTRRDARAPPQPFRLLCFTGGSRNIHNLSACLASVLILGGPPLVRSTKKLGPLHGCGALCARIQANGGCVMCSYSPAGQI